MELYVFEEFGLAEEGADAEPELLGGEGFADVALGTSGNGAENHGLGSFGGDHDGGNSQGKVFGAAAFEELDSVHLGHVDIGEDEAEGRGVAFVAAEGLEGFDSVGGVEDLGEEESGLTECPLDDFAHDGGVFDDECAHGVVLCSDVLVKTTKFVGADRSAYLGG